MEEVGLRGATTSVDVVDPDVAIILESDIAGDVPGIKPEESSVKLGQGPTLVVFDARMIPNLKLRDLVVDTAKELDIPLQFSAMEGGATDGAAIHLHKSGVPTVVIGVPARHIHSHTSIIHRDDYDNAAQVARRRGQEVRCGDRGRVDPVILDCRLCPAQGILRSTFLDAKIRNLQFSIAGGRMASQAPEMVRDIAAALQKQLEMFAPNGGSRRRRHRPRSGRWHRPRLRTGWRASERDGAVRKRHAGHRVQPGKRPAWASSSWASIPRSKKARPCAPQAASSRSRSAMR